MICDRLKILLNELDISQRQFAMKINLDAGYFSRIIQGKVTPPDRILLLIENVFNVDKKWLEDGEGEIFSTNGMSSAKKQVLEYIDSLNDEQVNAVSSFIKYLTQSKDEWPQYNIYNQYFIVVSSCWLHWNGGDNLNIHERLKLLREQLNLTTRAFAVSINMSGSAITNMEKGQRNITDRTIRDICREYSVRPDWLINGNEPMYEDICKWPR